MNSVTVQLPESLHRNLRAVAEREGYSVDQFIATAAAEKMAAMETIDFLRREAALAGRQDFDDFLAAVPAGPVAATDRMPD